MQQQSPRYSSPHPSQQQGRSATTPRQSSANHRSESPTMRRIPAVTSANSSPSATAVRRSTSTVALPQYAQQAIVQAWVVYKEPEDVDWVRRWVRITETTFDLHLSAQDPNPQESLELRELFVGTPGGRRFRISTGNDDFLEFRCCDDTEYDEFIAALLARCRREGEATVEVDWKRMYDELLKRYNDLLGKYQQQGRHIDDLQKEITRVENLLGDMQVAHMELKEKFSSAQDRIRQLELENTKLRAMLDERDDKVDDLEALLTELRKPKPTNDQATQCLLFDPSQYTLLHPTASVATQSSAPSLGSHLCQTTLTGPVVSTKDVVNRPTCHVLTQTQVTGPVWHGKAGSDLGQFAHTMGRLEALTKVITQVPVNHLDLATISNDDIEDMLKEVDQVVKTLGPNGVQALPDHLQHALATARAKAAEYSRLLAERQALQKKQGGRRLVDLMRVHEGDGWLECAATVVQVKAQESPENRFADPNNRAGLGGGGISPRRNLLAGGGGGGGAPTTQSDPAAKWRKLNKIFQHEMTAGAMGTLHDDIAALGDLSSQDNDLRAACEKFNVRYRQLLKHTDQELEFLLRLGDWETRCRECIANVDALKEMVTVEHLIDLKGAMGTYMGATPDIHKVATGLVEQEPYPGHPLANILCTRIGLLHADFYARTQRDTRDFLRHHRSAESIARFALSLKRASQIVAKVRGCEMFAVEFAAAWPIAGELVELPRRMVAEDVILTKLKEWVSMDLTLGRLRLTQLQNPSHY